MQTSALKGSRVRPAAQRRARTIGLAIRATVTMKPSTSELITNNSTQFLRKHMLKLAPYTPIEPFEVLSTRYGRKPEDIIKLDANENPYGPPPEVRQALGSMPFPHIYPDPETRALRQALSKMNNIPMDNLLVMMMTYSIYKGIVALRYCFKTMYCLMLEFHYIMSMY